jgi:hypothetical protein
VLRTQCRFFLRCGLPAGGPDPPGPPGSDRLGALGPARPPPRPGRPARYPGRPAPWPDRRPGAAGPRPTSRTGATVTAARRGRARAPPARRRPRRRAPRARRGRIRRRRPPWSGSGRWVGGRRRTSRPRTSRRSRRTSRLRRSRLDRMAGGGRTSSSPTPCPDRGGWIYPPPDNRDSHHARALCRSRTATADSPSVAPLVTPACPRRNCCTSRFQSQPRQTSTTYTRSSRSLAASAGNSARGRACPAA